MSDATQPDAALNRRRVLLVEDDWLIADAIADELQRVGFEVVGPASSVKAALQIMENEDFDAGLLDFRLNNETSAPIAEELARRHVSFAFLTGYSARELPPHLRESVVLNKPVTMNELKLTLERLVGEKVQSGTNTAVSP